MWFLRNAQVCSAAFASEVLLPQFGWPLYGSLSLILVVWTGIGVMFSGRFDLGEIVTLILFIGFCGMMLMSYSTTPVIWGNTPFPLLIASLGQDVADTFVTGVWTNFNTTFKQQMDLAMKGQLALEVDEGTQNQTLVTAWDMGLWALQVRLHGYTRAGICGMTTSIPGSCGGRSATCLRSSIWLCSLLAPFLF